jgi:hypothetical protein
MSNSTFQNYVANGAGGLPPITAALCERWDANQQASSRCTGRSDRLRSASGLSPTPFTRSSRASSRYKAADVAGGQTTTSRVGETANANQLQQSNQQHWPRHTGESNDSCASSG